MQAQRVSSSTRAGIGSRLNPAASAAVVAAPCDPVRPTQAWTDVAGVLTTTEADGRAWCVSDVHGTEEVGSWRALPCAAGPGTAVRHRTVAPTGGGGGAATALVTASGGHLTLNNAMGASGPAPHTRYLSADPERAVTSSWRREPVGTGTGTGPAFRLMAADRTAVRDDDKMGGTATSNECCCQRRLQPSALPPGLSSTWPPSEHPTPTRIIPEHRGLSLFLTFFLSFFLSFFLFFQNFSLFSLDLPFPLLSAMRPGTRRVPLLGSVFIAYWSVLAIQ